MAWPVSGSSWDAGNEDQKEKDLNHAIGNRIALKIDFPMPFLRHEGLVDVGCMLSFCTTVCEFGGPDSIHL